MAGEPRDIEAHEAIAKGVRTHHCEMPNGEHRFRLQRDDGTAYSRTEAPDHGGSQRITLTAVCARPISSSAAVSLSRN